MLLLPFPLHVYLSRQLQLDYKAEVDIGTATEVEARKYFVHFFVREWLTEDDRFLVIFASCWLSLFIVFFPETGRFLAHISSDLS